MRKKKTKLNSKFDFEFENALNEKSPKESVF